MDDLTRRLRAEIPAREPDDAFMARLASIAGLGTLVAPNSLRRIVRLAVAAVVALLLLSGAAYAATRVGDDKPAPPQVPVPHSTAPRPTPTDSEPTQPTTPAETGDQDDHGEDEDEQGRDGDGGDDAPEGVSGEDDSHDDGTDGAGSDDHEPDGSGTAVDSGDSPD